MKNSKEKNYNKERERYKSKEDMYKLVLEDKIILPLEKAKIRLFHRIRAIL